MKLTSVIFPPKDFCSKEKKWRLLYQFGNSNKSKHWISASTNNFDVLEEIYPERILLVKNGKNEHISLGSLSLGLVKLTNSTLLTKFTQKWDHCLKTNYHNWNLIIRMSLGTKLAFELIIHIFRNKLNRNLW